MSIVTFHHMTVFIEAKRVSNKVLETNGTLFMPDTIPSDRAMLLRHTNI
jgi:hypothetical protein